MKKIATLFVLTFYFTTLFATNKNNESLVRLQTTKGDIVVKLYAETPKHRMNFLKLVKAGHYDGLLFHRVIANFMIQAGDPVSRNAIKGQSLGSGDVGYTVPAEIIYPKYFHKKGVLAAAREGDKNNPKRASSGCQFYLVVGHAFTDLQLSDMELAKKKILKATLLQKIMRTKQEELNRYKASKNDGKVKDLQEMISKEVEKALMKDSSYKFTDEQWNAYKTIGGTPHLDNAYTVFGEVTEGLDIVEAISKTKTGKEDRPIEDIRILKATVVQ
ncbi:MAG: peptidylprolyl isomerase [Bacteroidales bacterium]|nr:peptidylprolyl isomerase [Bacteroidales bacterium]